MTSQVCPVDGGGCADPHCVERCDRARKAARQERSDSVDASLARQLQRSMERNARMVNRLQKLAKTFADASSETPAAIAAIIKDEEPTW